MVILKLCIKISIVALLLTLACHKNTEEPLQPPFETTPRSVSVNIIIKEASGIAESKINPGYLWVHEDSGNPSQLFLLKTDGTLLKSVFTEDASNMDWEDMSLSKGPDASRDYIYLADIGDNGLNRTECVIYRFAEPGSTTDTIRGIEKIRIKYPNGPHDAEAIIVDNSTKDIYIITKSDDPAQVYKIPYPQSLVSENQAVLVGTLSFTGVTGAAISADGKEIIIKSYPALSYFARNSS